MLGSDVGGRQSYPDLGAAAILDEVPTPLRALLHRIGHGIDDLSEVGSAKGVTARETMHAVRSALSDICALTESNPKILRAVERLVSAGERLAEPGDRPRRSLAAARGAATRALKDLTAALVGTRPSRIARSLGRGW
ncbi:hypothetical protein, partial [Methylobacterium tarhaniae]|uniref:hypothetical protein n=1 Tax=Methylobacterium tarhaniae TaxID=1187852 RepID=UPI00069F08A5